MFMLLLLLSPSRFHLRLIFVSFCPNTARAGVKSPFFFWLFYSVSIASLSFPPSSPLSHKTVWLLPFFVSTPLLATLVPRVHFKDSCQIHLPIICQSSSNRFSSTQAGVDGRSVPLFLWESRPKSVNQNCQFELASCRGQVSFSFRPKILSYVIILS